MRPVNSDFLSLYFNFNRCAEGRQQAVAIRGSLCPIPSLFAKHKGQYQKLRDNECPQFAPRNSETMSVHNLPRDREIFGIHDLVNYLGAHVFQ
jgi:hypothetical protein